MLLLLLLLLLLLRSLLLLALLLRKGCSHQENTGVHARSRPATTHMVGRDHAAAACLASAPHPGKAVQHVAGLLHKAPLSPA
jgi:hypothetical protein